MYLISLYFSVIIAKIAVLTPSDEINIIEKVNNVRIPFPIKKVDGKIKNNIIKDNKQIKILVYYLFKIPQ